MPSNNHTLTINAGSSSVKLTLFSAARSPKKLLEATVMNIGQAAPKLTTHNYARPASDTVPVQAQDHAAAAAALTEWLKLQVPDAGITAIGHRIVHGGPKYYQPQIITDVVVAELRTLIPFDPEHLPSELRLIEEFGKLFPEAIQVACFDTAFHHDLPARAKLLPIPRRLEREGVRKYGFHGLSYAYILEELRRVEGEAAANGKVVIAHLGSGVSLAAVQEGESIDTTMGLTPAAGVPMSTRSGDLDPGLNLYLAHTQGYDPERFNHMVNFESGLLGISETTADMEKLLEIENDDRRAKDAVDIFCYQVKKTIGSLAAALGGLNTLVFTGGMGENAPKIRARVCDGLQFLGVALDESRNQEGARLISTDGGQVGVHVIHTDEAVTMVREMANVMQRNM